MRTAVAEKEPKRESVSIRVHVMRKGSAYLDGVIALEELYPQISFQEPGWVDAPCGQSTSTVLCGGVCDSDVARCHHSSTRAKWLSRILTVYHPWHSPHRHNNQISAQLLHNRNFTFFNHSITRFLISTFAGEISRDA